jgi:hypothetical protein
VNKVDSNDELVFKASVVLGEGVPWRSLIAVQVLLQYSVSCNAFSQTKVFAAADYLQKRRQVLSFAHKFLALFVVAVEEFCHSLLEVRL